MPLAPSVAATFYAWKKREKTSHWLKKILIASGEESIINFVQVHKVLKFTEAKFVPIKEKALLTSNC